MKAHGGSTPGQACVQRGQRSLAPDCAGMRGASDPSLPLDRVLNFYDCGKNILARGIRVSVNDEGEILADDKT